MVTLTGENLGQRQQDLNRQVLDAVTREAKFKKLRKKPNLSDVDVLFKIDLASKYKKVDYILEILKSGDSLYISRALKCTWMYDDDFANVINKDYLHNKIFTSMSLKMKLKFLSTLSTYLRNEERAESFYTYCVGAKLLKNSLKFLIFTSEKFKIDFVTRSFDDILVEEEVFFKNFVRNSFSLAEAIMKETTSHPRTAILYYLRHLMSVSQENYLNMLEKYDSHDNVGNRFGLRISKHILDKYKHRCIDEHPHLYMARLNKSLVTKHMNLIETKVILKKLMPKDSETFWHTKYCDKFDFLLNKFPLGEKFRFVKLMFNDKYPKEPFEMNKMFLDLRYYEMMTVDEKETWALNHIECNSHVQGLGRNYMWYEYVNFEKAFPEIKNFVLITPDLKQRHAIVEVLIKSVRNQRDMQTLLTYYYDRHANEPSFCKEQFITSVIKEHNVFEFENDCWTAFNKILSSLKVYKTADACNNSLIMYMAIMYHIVNKINLPEILKKYILEHQMDWRYDKNILYQKINKETQDQIYEFITNTYVDEISKHLSGTTEDGDLNIDTCVRLYIGYLESHNKSSDDCSPIITEYVNDHWEAYNKRSLFKKNVKAETLTEADLIRKLKKDSTIAVENLAKLKENIIQNPTESKINTFLKKIKIYFYDDIAKEYYDFYLKTLAETKPATMTGICNIVYGILQLADHQANIDFVTKYAPKESKINHDEIDEVFLGIQESICKYICFTRPPVPLSNVLQYIKGDYLKHCLPMFQSYLSKLPQPLLQEFVMSLIDTPVSVQKHAIRLVFECFNLEDLKKTVCKSWNKTKNVSLRFVLYQSLYNKLCDEDDTLHAELFEVLKQFTAELKIDDNSEIFDRFMVSNKLPDKLLGSYIQTCWETVNRFPDQTEYNRIKRKVVYNITDLIGLFEPDFVKGIVEEHVNNMFTGKDILPENEDDELNELNNLKWKLVATYIIYYASDKDYVNKNIEFVRLILNKCIKSWDFMRDDMFICRQFCWLFIEDLICIDTDKCCTESIPIFETIIQFLEGNFPLRQSYRALWSLKLTILRRKEMQQVKVNYNSGNKDLAGLIRKAMYDYGVKVGTLVKQNMDTNTYFITANNAIADMIKDNIDAIMSVNIGSYYGALLYESATGRLLVAGGLAEVQTKATFLLALYILPMQSDDVEYTALIDQIENFQDEEVQFNWFNKFIYKNYKKTMGD